MKDIDIFLELYKVERDFMVHHEKQRSTASNLLLTVAVILIGFITYDNELTSSDLPATVTLVIIGIFGCFFTLKEYERFRYHHFRSQKYRLAIDAALRYCELNSNKDLKIREEIRKDLKLDPDKSTCLIQSIIETAENEYQEQGNFLAKLAKTRLHHFWLGPHILTSIIGVVIAISIIKSI